MNIISTRYNLSAALATTWTVANLECQSQQYQSLFVWPLIGDSLSFLWRRKHLFFASHYGSSQRSERTVFFKRTFDDGTRKHTCAHTHAQEKLIAKHFPNTITLSDEKTNEISKSKCIRD